MKFTGRLTAQNTSVLLCNVIEPRAHDTYFANVFVGGTFGGGTVSIVGSFDGGVTTYPLVSDGSGTAITFTAAGSGNIRCGHISKTSDKFGIYASIATATNPSLDITVLDNR